MNSGPLSQRTNPGTPRSNMSRSSTATTPSASIPRSTRIAGHSRVNSSMTFQQLQLPTAGGGVELEIQSPHDVRPDRAERPNLRAQTRQPFLPAPPWYSQSLLAPQTAYALVVDDPSRPSCALRSTTPPPPRALLRKRNQEFAQASLLIVDHRRREALGGAVLADNPTRPALGDPEPVTQHHNGGAPTVRGQTFPSANSLSMSMSRA